MQGMAVPVLTLEIASAVLCWNPLRMVQYAGLSSSQVQHRWSGLNWISPKYSSCLHSALWDQCRTGMHAADNMAQIDVLAVVELGALSAVSMCNPANYGARCRWVVCFQWCSSKSVMYCCTSCCIAEISQGCTALPPITPVYLSSCCWSGRSSIVIPQAAPPAPPPAPLLAPSCMV